MTGAVDLFGRPTRSGPPIRQLPLPLGWRERGRGKAELLVSDCNREALMALEGWASWPEPIAVLSGPPRSGKSLLAAHFARLCPEAVIHDPATAVSEAALFHACNRALADRRPLLIVAPAEPGMWLPDLADLRTRIAAAQQLTIAEPDPALLATLLIHRFDSAGQLLAPDVAQYVAARLERSYAALAYVADRLLDEARGGGPLTLARVRLLLAETLAGEGQRADG